MKNFYKSLLALLLLLLPASAWAETLSEGSSGARVTELQEALKSAGYFAREADGEYGSATVKAVSLFQEDHELSVTGKADDEMRELLRGSTPRAAGGGVLLAFGNYGDEVKRCQEALAAHGYLSENADGVYGSRTVAAVKAFQKAKKLPASGAIDEETFAALGVKQEKKKPAEKKAKTKKAERGETKKVSSEKKKTAPSEHIRTLQKKLNANGFDAGEEDGVWGDRTSHAVKVFQRTHDLEETGKLDKATEEKINALNGTPAALKRGARGGRVAQLQNLLTLHGFSDGKSDGIFGGGTEEELKNFQRHYDLEESGSADEKTWALLRSAPEFRGDYTKCVEMSSTAYTPYDGGGEGRTAMGNLAGKGHAAVDPDVIPLGSILYIENYGYAVADDIGGSIVGDTVDVGVDTLEQAYRWGTRRVKVYVIR